MSTAHQTALTLLTSAEELATGHWKELPHALYLDVAAAWSEYRAGNDDEAIAHIGPALNIITAMAHRYGWGA